MTGLSCVVCDTLPHSSVVSVYRRKRSLLYFDSWEFFEDAIGHLPRLPSYLTGVRPKSFSLSRFQVES